MVGAAVQVGGHLGLLRVHLRDGVAEAPPQAPQFLEELLGLLRRAGIEHMVVGSR
jgi:hypothetical protein